MAKRSQSLQDFASPKVIKAGGARCPGQLIQLGKVMWQSTYELLETNPDN
jgi:hypothetical protein